MCVLTLVLFLKFEICLTELCNEDNGVKIECEGNVQNDRRASALFILQLDLKERNRPSGTNAFR